MSDAIRHALLFLVGVTAVSLPGSASGGPAGPPPQAGVPSPDCSRAPRSAVRTSAPVVRGALSPSQVRVGIAAAFGDPRACAHAERGPVTGLATVRFVVHRDGRPGMIRVRGLPEPVASCLRTSLERVHFPRAVGITTVHTTVRMVQTKPRCVGPAPR